MMNTDPKVYVSELDNAQAGVTGLTTGGVGMVKQVTATTYDVTIYHNIAAVTAAHIHGPSSGPTNSTGALVVICGSAGACGAGVPLKFTGLAELRTETWTWIKQGI